MICTVPGCENPGDGLCGPHAYRLRTYGTTYPSIPLGGILPVGVEPDPTPSLFDDAEV